MTLTLVSGRCQAPGGGFRYLGMVAMEYQLWRLVSVKDQSRSTWELIGTFKTPKRAREQLYKLAGTNVVSPDEELFRFDSTEGEQIFRIEATPIPAPSVSPPASD